MWQQLTAFSALRTSDEDEEQLADADWAAPQEPGSDEDLGEVADENQDTMMLLAGSAGRQREVPFAASRNMGLMSQGRRRTMYITGATLLACCALGVVVARSRAAMATGDRAKAAAGSEDGMMEAFKPPAVKPPIAPVPGGHCPYANHPCCCPCCCGSCGGGPVPVPAPTPQGIIIEPTPAPAPTPSHHEKPSSCTWFKCPEGTSLKLNPGDIKCYEPGRGRPECDERLCCNSDPPEVCDLNCYQDHGAIDVDLGDCGSGTVTDDECRECCLGHEDCEAVLRNKDDDNLCAGKKDIHTAYCLPGENWELEILREHPWGKCAILGDPHIYTFDRPYSPDIGKYDQGYFWIIHCQQSLLIEGKFSFTEMYPGESSATGIAISGEIIDNNVLIVAYTGHGEWQNGFSAWWNGQAILTGYPSTFDSPEANDDGTPILVASKGAMDPDNFHSNARHTIGTQGGTLPSYLLKFGGANLQVYILLGQDAMNVVIEMKRLPMQCDGYCGNFNCVAADDTIQALQHRSMSGPLSSAENMFNGHGLPQIQFEEGATDVSDCPSEKMQAAKEACGGLHEELRAGCMFDCCKHAGPGCDGIAALEKAAEKVEKQVDKDVNKQTEADESAKGEGGMAKEWRSADGLKHR